MDSYLAKRLQLLDSGVIRKALQANSQDIIDLSIGYPFGPTPRHIKLAGTDAIQKDRTLYTPANGIVELRAAVANKLARDNNINSSPESITITPGATSAILLTYLAILNPGDEVLLPEPYFPPYKELAEMLGAKVRFIDTRPSFDLTASSIEPHVNTRTKLLVINSPNNPTGAVYPESELKKISVLARKHKLLIASDEVYEYFTYAKPHFSIGSIYPSTLTINSLSKSYAMTGWRLGYIHGPVEIIEAINELLQYSLFASSTIAQHAALAALKESPNELSGKYLPKREVAMSVLNGAFGTINGGGGAFYLFPRLPSPVLDTEFVSKLQRAGVKVLQGSIFSRYNDYIRISYSVPDAKLKTGLRRIIQCLESIQPGQH